MIKAETIRSGVVLTLCAAAVVAGMRSFTAIAGWVADVPAAVLANLYGIAAPGYPSKTTLWRVVTGVDAYAVDAAIGAWLAEQTRQPTGSRPPTTPSTPNPRLIKPTIRHSRPLWNCSRSLWTAKRCGARSIATAPRYI